jgi:hypothetical protein
MPQLGKYKWIKEIVFFLYESEEDAFTGSNFGGSGFLVGVPSRRWGHHFVHAHGVTNWHVAVQGASVVRINRRDGTPEIFDFGPDQWIFEPNGPDLAISPPLEVNTQNHIVSSIGIENLLTDELAAAIDFDAAEDAFMVGRFVDYDGHETNQPAIRFGHVSMTHANVEQPNRYAGRSIVLDMHSRTGFSGSPVFMYRTPGSGFAEDGQWFTGSTLYVLGLHWGQFREQWEIRDNSKHAAMNDQNKQYVKGLSGMTLIVPAQAISDMLVNNAQLKAMREVRELEMVEKITKAQVRAPSAENTNTALFGAPNASEERKEELSKLFNKAANDAGNGESAYLPTDENPNHREDFMRLVGEAARTAPQDDQT